MNERLAAALWKLQKLRTSEVTPFPKQDAFINDTAQFRTALCTRRAGKTSALAEAFKKIMDRYPNSLCRYIALTRDSAKDIMWQVLQDMDEKYGWEAEFLESSLTMKLKNGARLRLLGADMKNFIKRLKGAKSPAVAIDEAQDFGEHLETLVDDVLTPTLADYTDSWLAVTGTPGPIPRGYFYDITHKMLHGYSVHKWGLYENPYLPDPQGFVDKLKAKKQWGDDHPTYLREYKGIWVLDTESLLIRYNEQLNHFDALPPANYTYILGVDIGFNDADALAVVAWTESSPNIYLVEEITTRGQDITELSNQITKMQAKYDIAKIVIDAGALGKKIAEELRRRKQIPIEAADKTRKFENIAFLNEWLRLGRFKAKNNSTFAQDSYMLQIDQDATTPDRIVTKKGFHSDIIDAVLYAFKESPAFTYQKQPDKPKPNTPEWYEQEVSDMEQKAIEFFNRQEEASEGFGL